MSMSLGNEIIADAEGKPDIMRDGELACMEDLTVIAEVQTRLDCCQR